MTLPAGRDDDSTDSRRALDGYAPNESSAHGAEVIDIAEHRAPARSATRRLAHLVRSAREQLSPAPAPAQLALDPIAHARAELLELARERRSAAALRVNLSPPLGRDVRELLAALRDASDLGLAFVCRVPGSPVDHVHAVVFAQLREALELRLDGLGLDDAAVGIAQLWGWRAFRSGEEHQLRRDFRALLVYALGLERHRGKPERCLEVLGWGATGLEHAADCLRLAHCAEPSSQRRCAASDCGKPIEGGRRDRRFCSDRCKSRTWWRAKGKTS